MRIELFAPQGGSWAQLQDAARLAEAAGCSALAVPEIDTDPFGSLVASAMVTERLHLRTAIVVAFARSPMTVATAAWDLHVNSGGRFGLGLGTQVKAHNVRRFSVPWTPPSPRLHEYVTALRAIWRCWQLGEKLRFEGKHYQFTLMSPEFSPPKTEHGPIPIHTAAVRPAMMRLAGRVGNGVRLHGFSTRAYQEQVALPQLSIGLGRTGRPRERFEVCGGGFVATGPTEDAARAQAEWVRYRVAFYASTPSYWPVLAVHGWEDLGRELHQMTRDGRWKEMGAKITDEVLYTFAVCAPFRNLKTTVAERFEGLSDSIELGWQAGLEPGALAEVVQDIATIPTRFEHHDTQWDEGL
jgi:probable F420-dependent oxidoreductase